MPTRPSRTTMPRAAASGTSRPRRRCCPTACLGGLGRAAVVVPLAVGGVAGVPLRDRGLADGRLRRERALMAGSALAGAVRGGQGGLGGEAANVVDRVPAVV